MIRVFAAFLALIGVTAIAATAQDTAFKSPVVAFGDKAPTTWAMAKMQVDTKIGSDRDVVFTSVPKDLNGASFLQRKTADHNTWLPAGGVTAKKDCTVYVMIRAKSNNRDIVPEATLKKIEDDGWKAVDGELGTSVSNNEKVTWAIYKKDVKAGDVDVTLKTVKWSTRTPVLFAFK